MNQSTELLLAATTAAQRGGDILMRYLRDGVEMRAKSHEGAKTYDLVSDADIESENAIAKHLHSKYPTHHLLGEENLHAEADSDNLWIIDPLDGTNNFAHGVLHFGVSIAYYCKGTPIVAAVFNPARDEMYTAIAGGGAFLNGRAIEVSRDGKLSQSLIGCGFYYDRGEMMKKTLAAIESFFAEDIHGIRRFGTASLDLCQVASGQFGGFFEYQLSPWDFAAGALILTEAGGKITTARGDELPIEKTSVLASNGLLHDAMLTITKAHHP
ncbi:inositol monophosphatase [Rubripirellula amarantea]|uniref:Inositol-1-monophosphatase n=1 Tax=Rubripirellula amarantea TaxID=2527999 RepID=A0A5C5WUJ1_9BACT|nr:inositol monophosphatase family protein [Rubripirellula amarantea]MDA8744013.1 inositol monophosphatase [Rubripirellula amarantea]TWT54316.1 Inositol-1-monophosphatase [Rubripirellula amarantea]